MKQSVISMMDLLCVSALLLLFGLSTFTLVSVGADAYSRLLDKRESTSDMRIASSYISMKVRRCDETDAAFVRREPTGEVLVLSNTDEYGDALETRIYLYDGMLCEVIAYPDESFDPELGFEVVPLEAFEVVLDAGTLTFTLKRDDLTRVFSLRLRSGAAL